MIGRVVALPLVAACLVSGCGQEGKQQSKSGERIRIGFIVKQPDELWFQNEWKYAQRCADKYGFELIKIGAPDGEKVLAAIDTLGAEGAQGFVICTPDVKLGPAIMTRARKYGMKVFSVDDQFVGHDGKFMDVPYMGLSAREIGRQVGRELYKELKRRKWPPDGTAACAITYDELNTLKERIAGTTEALVGAGFPADRIYRAPERTTDVPGAYAAANGLLTQHPEVKRWVVFSVNDEGVLGAIRAMEGRGHNAQTILAIGIGAGTGLQEFLKPKPTGYFATCLISPLRHGYESSEVLYKWIKDGVQPPKDTRTTGIMCTRENFRQVLKEQGLEEVLSH